MLKGNETARKEYLRLIQHSDSLKNLKRALNTSIIFLSVNLMFDYGQFNHNCFRVTSDL